MAGADPRAEGAAGIPGGTADVSRGADGARAGPCESAPIERCKSRTVEAVAPCRRGRQEGQHELRLADACLYGDHLRDGMCGGSGRAFRSREARGPSSTPEQRGLMHTTRARLLLVRDSGEATRARHSDMPRRRQR